MSHTNSTANYNLPQFITTDKPAWLTDVNNAYSAIDLGMKAAKDAGDNAQADATQALTDAGNAQTAANTAGSKASGAIASISEDFLDSATYAVGDLVMYNNLLYRCHTAVTTPGAWTGSTNWTRTDIDSLLGEKPSSLSGLTDTDIVSPSANQILAYDGSSWENSNILNSKQDKLSNVIDIDGSTITVRHYGNIYSVGLKACPVRDIYSILASYTTAKFFRFMAWDMTNNKPVCISVGESTVSVIDANTWTVISNTDTRTISGGATYII